MNANEANSFDVLVEDTAITVVGHYALAQPKNKPLSCPLRYRPEPTMVHHHCRFSANVNGFYNGY
jgi:hypothetical protein